MNQYESEYAIELISMRPGNALTSAIPDVPDGVATSAKLRRLGDSLAAAKRPSDGNVAGRSVVIWAGPAQLRIQAFGDGESAP